MRGLIKSLTGGIVSTISIDAVSAASRGIMTRLTPEEAKAVIERGKEAEASLACEGIYLTDEERQLFAYMDEQRLPHEERRKMIDAYFFGRLSPLPWLK